MRWGQDGAVRVRSCPCFFCVLEERNTQKDYFGRNLFELFAEILQIIQINLTVRHFMSMILS